MSIKPWAISVAAALVVALAPVSGAAADTGAQPCRDAPDKAVATGAVFSNPVSEDPDALIGQICSLVHQTPSGASIRIAMFVISGASGMDFATELVKAHRRGVNVQLVVDGWQDDNPAVETLKNEFGTDETARSFIHVCTGLSPEGNTAACIGTKGMHNKFYLFSQTGGARDVVVQSSANFTDLNVANYFNNAVTVTGNRLLYEAYGSYFDDLAAERRTDNYYRVTTTGTASGMLRSYFFPRAGTDSSTDPIVEILGKVSCAGGTVIRIGMSEWSSYRIAIADRLRELAGDGCVVQIVYGKADAGAHQALTAPGIELRRLGDGAEFAGRLHSKYLLIEGTYDGDQDARRVFTGSHNYNQTSLRRNDDAMLETNIRDIYNQYLANFLVLRSHAQTE